MNAAQEIELLVRARYPIIYVVSSEELRVQRLIVALGEKSQKRVYEWTCSVGMVPAGTSIQSARHRNAGTRDPIAALDYIIDHVEPAIFILKDFHAFLVKSNYQVIRKLKEIGQHLKNSCKTVVLVSPVVEIPTELDKEVTLLSFPLPSMDDLAELLDRIAVEIQSVAPIPIETDSAGREKILRAALGLTLVEAENVFARIIVKNKRLCADDLVEVLAEKQQIIRKNGLLEYCPVNEAFSDVGGLKGLKDWLMKRSVAFTEEARSFGLPAPKGVLLLGVQGCGKSLCAKAVSSLWQVPLLRFDIGRMFASFVGSSEENVRRALDVAESIAPAILWIDEIDKAFSGFRGSGHSDSGTTGRVFGTLLTWLSEKSSPVFVVATANSIADLPPELLRKGRFDELFFVDLPSEAERREIFAIHLRKRGRDPARFDMAALGAASERFSGAEIEQAMISALFDIFADRSELRTENLLHSLNQTNPLANTMDSQITALREWAGGRARIASAVGS